MASSVWPAVLLPGRVLPADPAYRGKMAEHLGAEAATRPA